MKNKTQFNIWYWAAAFFGLMLFQYVFTTATQVAEIPYSQFETYLEEGRIAEVAVSDRFIQGLHYARGWPAHVHHYQGDAGPGA